MNKKVLIPSSSPRKGSSSDALAEEKARCRKGCSMNKLGFGFLRLPKNGEEIDYSLLNQMVDHFLSHGGTYFDTAYTYMDGKSEIAIRESLVKRHPRESFCLADKLPSWKVTSHGDCKRYFEEQLNRCSTEFFDVYLLHWLNRDNYKICEKYDEFGFLRELKESGKTKKIGFSYHDSASLLDEILTAHPEVDIVQLQINYLDWDSTAIEAGNCYQVAKKHGKSIVVMEPVKGGTLASLPAEAEAIFKKIHPDQSMASWALRFAQSLSQVEVVLSGMNTMEQMMDNLRDVLPLTEEEQAAIHHAAAIITAQTAVPCTGCRYCESHCPKNIAIPDYFAMYNEIRRYPGDDWKIKPAYNTLAARHGNASDCIGCKSCERHCPQHLPITDYLVQVARVFGH